MTTIQTAKIEKTMTDKTLQALLVKRADELNLIVPKCARCTNPCAKCKLNFLKKTEPTVAPTSSIDSFKNKRKLEKFWAN